MKLKQILESDKFSTSQTGVDPETGTVSWDVDYSPLLSFDKNLEKLNQDFQKIVKKYDDPYLEKVYEKFANLKKATRTHITRKYK